MSFPRIPILFTMIGTAAYGDNVVLPEGTEVLLHAPCAISGQAIGLTFSFAPRYPQTLLEEELKKQYGLVLSKDPAPTRCIHGWGDNWVQYLHYPQEGLAIAPGSETFHSRGCPLSGEETEWHPDCKGYGCSHETFQWGWHVGHARWHERELDKEGCVIPRVHRRDRIAGWYTIASLPQRYPQALFPKNPLAYEGYSLSQLGWYLRSLTS